MSPPSSNTFVKLMSVYSLYSTAGLVLGGIFEVYFYHLGLSIAEIVLTSAGLFAVPLLIMVFMRKFEARQSMMIGMAMNALGGLLLAFFPYPGVPFIARMIMGGSIFFFWMPMNVLYYEKSKKDNAFLSSIYYSVSAVLSLVLPAFAGWVAFAFGYPAMFLLAVALLLLNMAVTAVFVEPKRYSYDPVKSLRAISGLRTLFFIEGFSIMSISQITLSAMLLLFFTDPVNFGGMLSAVTVFAIIASFITARLSDHFGQRRMFLIAAALGFLISAVFTSLSGGVVLFFLGYGAITFFRSILMPLPLALAVDNSKDIVETMLGREIMLDLGRTVASIAGFALIILFDIRAMLIMQTLAAALYIPVFELKKKNLQKF
jgi:MFS family permease